ncbi:hypothetical protein CASFOL_010178 [Castilleja foliolosa]|uniref:SWIM-type domain-containing protein n=1 Tax=Castilleja foliolosa TaxID=1961234 RepID=A0ABD3DRT8_9LAMI
MVNEEESEYEGGHAYRFDYMRITSLILLLFQSLQREKRLLNQPNCTSSKHIDNSREVTVYISGIVQDDGEVDDCGLGLGLGVVDTEPGVGIDNEPGVNVVDIEPMVGVDTEPGVGIDNEPGVGIDNEPGVNVVDIEPMVGVDTEPGVGIDNEPGVGIDNEPGVGIDNEPGVNVVDTEPMVGVEWLDGGDAYVGGGSCDATDEYLHNLYEGNIDMATGYFVDEDSDEYDASSEDSEFDFGKEECENIDADDDELYDWFIDGDDSDEAEVPTDKGPEQGDDDVADHQGVGGDGESDVNPSDDNYHSGKDSDSELDRSRTPLFNSAAVLNPNFKLGMLFCNKEEISFHVKNLKSSWLCKQYGHMFKTDPKRIVNGFQADVMEDLSINVTKNQAYQAKYKSVAMLEGDSTQQYAMLWSYAEEIKRSNPGSTVIIGTDQSSGGNVFDRMYVCFKALKVGFLAGCRRLVGVDGCHLKGPHGGILLTAVGFDPNNNIYPIAYAVVGSENGGNWEWFLNLLKIDLEIQNDSEWTFMSDKQKGLIQAFQALLPNADHRFCVRHMHSNMKQAGFNGQAYKIAVWRAAKASTVNEFDRSRMEELKKLDEKAFDWLADKPPHQWSKAHFNCISKSDMLLNNLCETFNSNILEARDKPILSMMEWLHEYLMKRTSECRDRSKKKWKNQDDPCPRIQHIIQENIGKISNCVPLKADDSHYQIKCIDGSMFDVDLEKNSCGCRKWDLTGIPCKHALRAITCQGWDVTEYINNYYKVAKYNMVYQPVIMPINGRSEWPKTNYLAPEPPTFGRSAGRPKKTRRREPDEIVSKKRKRIRVRGSVNPNKTRRQQTSIHCSVCGVEGHNKRYCPLTKEPAATGDGGESSKVQATKAEKKGKNVEASQITQEDFSQLSQAQPSQGSQMKNPPSMWDQLQEQQGRNVGNRKRFVNPSNVKSVLSEVKGKGH